MRLERGKWLLTLLASGAMATPVTALVAGAAPPCPSLAIVGAGLYPSADAAPIADGPVVVTQGVISAMGPRVGVTVPAGAKIIDGKGLVVTAGFQNRHVHFTGLQGLDARHRTPVALGTALQVMLTRGGFTTVVDTASERANTLSLRQRVAAGEVPRPRIRTAGEALYPPDGVPFYVKEGAAAELVCHLPTPTTPAEAAAIVDAARFGESERRGIRAVGLAADLVVLTADPIRDVGAFAAVRATVRGGQILSSSERTP